MNKDCWLGVFDFLEDDEVLVALTAFENPTEYFKPSVYSTISCEWPSLPGKNVLHLMQAILQHPELAPNIRHVSFHSHPEDNHREDWDNNIQEAYAFPCCDRCGSDIGDIPGEIAPIEVWTQKSECYSDLVKQTQSIVDRAQFPDASKWHEALGLGDIYAYVAIFLSQLPNLEYLRLDYSFIWKDGFPGLMLKHALFTAPQGALSSFNALKSIDYGSNVPHPKPTSTGGEINYDGFPDCDPDQFMAWFHLPSVRSISIWLREFEGILSQENEGILSNVHTLVLARSLVSDKNLPSLLSQMTSLKSLHFGKEYDWICEIALQSYQSILEGLWSVSNTLEKLSIGVEYYSYAWMGPRYGTEEDHEYRDRFVGFLDRFSCLESAEVPISLLVGRDPERIREIHNFLPTTLKELCLQWDCTQTTGEWKTEYLLHDCITQILDMVHPIPLERIAIRMPHFFNGTIDEDLVQTRASLKELCAGKSINLEIINNDLSPGLWTQDVSYSRI